MKYVPINSNNYRNNSSFVSLQTGHYLKETWLLYSTFKSEIKMLNVSIEN